MDGHRRRRASAAWRRGIGLVAMVACLGVTACGGGQRVRPIANWRSQGATLGSDMLRAPRGITIPPAGLGVDLVNYRPLRHHVSQEIIRALGYMDNRASY